MANGWDPGQTSQRYCSKCQGPLTFISQYNKWYCYACSSYDGNEHDSDADVQPQKTVLTCQTCSDPLYYIKKYDQYFCYKCNTYSPATSLRSPKEEEPSPQARSTTVKAPQLVPSSSASGAHTGDTLRCPECGCAVQQGWVRCPECGSGLETSDLPERPVTTHAEKPSDFHSSRSEVGQKELEVTSLPHKMTKEKVPDPWEARKSGEFAWEPQALKEQEVREEQASDETYRWKAAASDDIKVRDLIAEEERLAREKAAREEAMAWRRNSRSETDSRNAAAAMIKEDREAAAKSIKKAWEVPNEPIKQDVRGQDGEFPDEHAVKLDNETEFLVDLFQALFGALLREPKQPISFYRSKLKVLSEKLEAVRKIKVDEKGNVKIFIRALEFNKVLSELSSVLDSIIEVEGKVSTRAEALAWAKEAISPIVMDYQDELEDLGIAAKLMNRAFATKLPSGIQGFDDMLHGGIPNGASIILQGPSSGEKEVFANQFLGCGLNENGSIMIVLTMISPDEWRTQMRALGNKLSDFEKEGQLVMVDWYTHKNERVRSVEVRGSVVLSSKSITNLEIAIDKAIKAIKDAPTKRAVIAILSPAIKALGFDMVYGFAQSIRGKFKKYNITGLFLLDKGMHDQNVMTSLHSVFDGVFDIERERVGDAMISKVGVLSLKGMPYDSKYHIIENTREGLVVKPSAMAPPPQMPGALTKY